MGRKPVDQKTTAKEYQPCAHKHKVSTESMAQSGSVSSGPKAPRKGTNESKPLAQVEQSSKYFDTSMIYDLENDFQTGGSVREPRKSDPSEVGSGVDPNLYTPGHALSGCEETGRVRPHTEKGQSWGRARYNEAMSQISRFISGPSRESRNPKESRGYEHRIKNQTKASEPDDFACELIGDILAIADSSNNHKTQRELKSTIHTSLRNPSRT
ncbi:unnamed protein product [Rhizoctonia solani]|uniref:Uncharacterized protein n=1 Tax=Rhizoctonia solani TaxID=456999 RepID=A0A8H3BK89_9AGAM|nr:unnamed protein product [Rhizoctonia solani]